MSKLSTDGLASSEVEPAAGQPVSAPNLQAALPQREAVRAGVAALVQPESAVALGGQPVVAGESQHVLPPEVAKSILEDFTLEVLEKRFHRTLSLPSGRISWEAVKAALQANREVMWSVAQMEQAGHEPHVLYFDHDGFEIGTCSQEAPETTRGCVYDIKAEKYLVERYPDQEFEGSAVEQARAMGLSLVTPERYRAVFQGRGQFDRGTWCWLQADTDTRDDDAAFSADDRGVYRRDVCNSDPSGGWRGSLWIPWVA